MLVVNTVRDMGKHSPNLALTLGHYIKQICQLKQSLSLQSEAKKDQEDAAAFNPPMGKPKKVTRMGKGAHFWAPHRDFFIFQPIFTNLVSNERSRRVLEDP